jgi:hypothetical protein
MISGIFSKIKYPSPVHSLREFTTSPTRGEVSLPIVEHRSCGKKRRDRADGYLSPCGRGRTFATRSEAKGRVRGIYPLPKLYTLFFLEPTKGRLSL